MAATLMSTRPKPLQPHSRLDSACSSLPPRRRASLVETHSSELRRTRHPVRPEERYSLSWHLQAARRSASPELSALARAGWRQPVPFNFLQGGTNHSLPVWVASTAPFLALCVIHPLRQSSIGASLNAYRYCEMVQHREGLWLHPTSGRRQGRLRPYLGGGAFPLSTKGRPWNSSLSRTRVRPQRRI